MIFFGVLSGTETVLPSQYLYFVFWLSLTNTIRRKSLSERRRQVGKSTELSDLFCFTDRDSKSLSERRRQVGKSTELCDLFCCTE